MRIAYLISHCYIPPSAICAVTFTNKAANEMRERLIKLLGKDQTAQIKMGTFHALCARFLRKYARHAGIEGNFTVCDAEERYVVSCSGKWMVRGTPLLKGGHQQEDHRQATETV